ncbi:MAG: hypothetical protein MJA83_03485 [Gammaproteobacteria bacterium]|nr:hypothetical protein [Gammaproteobacteria bacterium]
MAAALLKCLLCTRYQAIVFLLLGFTPATQAAPPVLPQGWRLPTEAELQDSLTTRNACTAYCLQTAADLNGDGLQDGAVLVIHSDGTRSAVFAYLASSGNAYQWYLLEEYGNAEAVLSMGVEHFARSKQDYFCAEADEFDAECGSWRTVSLDNPAIDYFRLDGAGSIFVWNAAGEKFFRYWYTDWFEELAVEQ